ncbi:MAG: hypothetical protein ABEJ05_10880 [Haloglomus sp.]
MQRRTLIAALGAGLASLAGCTSIGGTDGAGGGTPTDQPPPTDQPSPTPTPTSSPAAASLSVSVRALQPAVVMLATDSIHLSGADAHQYLYLEVSVDEGRPPARDELTVRFDGTTSQPMQTRGLWYGYNHRNERYRSERGAGWLLYELPPSGDASAAVLEWPGGEWRPDAALRERLAAPAPSLSMNAAIPETVPPDSEPTIGFTVTNEGRIDGRFVAALNRTGPRVAYAPIEAVSRLVPAGETTTFEVTDTYDVEGTDPEERGDGEPDFTYHLDWLEGEINRSVRVAEV